MMVDQTACTADQLHLPLSTDLFTTAIAADSESFAVRIVLQIPITPTRRLANHAKLFSVKRYTVSLESGQIK